MVKFKNLLLSEIVGFAGDFSSDELLESEELLLDELFELESDELPDELPELLPDEFVLVEDALLAD